MSTTAKPSNVVCEDGVCHIDFSKSKKKNAFTEQPSASTLSAGAKKVEELIKKDKAIVVFSKTFCPYCDQAKALLKSKSAAHEVVELDTIDGGEAMHAHLKELTGQTSVPNIYIHGVHVGGCSDLVKLNETGELDKMLGA